MSKPAIVDVDVTVISKVLERARAALSPEDHQCLESLVQTLLDLSKLVRDRGTTIARLRRLFGLSSSEKSADVLPSDVPAPASSAAGPGNDASSSNAAVGDAHDNAAVGDAHDNAAVGDAHDNAAVGDAHDNAAVGDAHDNAAVGDADAEAKPKNTRKGHGRIGASQYPQAHRITVEHQSLHAGDACPGCACSTLHRLAEPARIVRIVGAAPLTAAAWECERLRCSGCGDVFTARAPAQAYGPKYDETAVSMMALLRYGAGMPLHRLDRLQKNLQTPVPASTQWEVVRDRVPALEPVHRELCQHAAQGRVLHNDDTSVRILELMGKRRAELCAKGELPDPDRTGLFTTGVVAVTDAGPIALFFTGRQHAGENLAALLAQRDPALPPPIQMCDGLERNAPSGHQVVESNCLSHGRRHIVDEVANFPHHCRHVLETLGKIFHNDSTCRELDLHAQQRLEFHQRESAPVMAELQKWLRAQLDEKRVEANSGLGQAFRYLLKRWHKLTAFLREPDAPLDNNICERVLKMAIRHRNNSLFYRSARGAKTGDIYMALIYTAELHGENPFDYLTALLRHETDVAAAPAAWLPWTFRATLAHRPRAAA